MLILRKAKKEEAHLCYQFIESARAYHKSLGFEQWHPDYPALHTIENDIENGIGFVFTENDVPVGYCCMIAGVEPAYHIIDGAWKTKRPYAVIHRMAFDGEFRGKGLSGEAFSLIKEACADQGIEALRVDTQSENTVMQHILQKEGFEYC